MFEWRWERSNARDWMKQIKGNLEVVGSEPCQPVWLVARYRRHNQTHAHTHARNPNQSESDHGERQRRGERASEIEKVRDSDKWVGALTKQRKNL